MPETTHGEDRVKEEVLQTTRGETGNLQKKRRRFYLADELQTAEIKEPSYILNPLIPRGRIILGVGDSTQGKTPFGLQLARDIAGGLDFLDYYKTTRGPTRVALIDAESPKEDISLRLKMQGRCRPTESRDNLLLLDVDSVFESDFDVTRTGIERMREFVKDEKVDGRKSCKQNLNGKPNNWATSLFPLNPRPHD
jgi:hypothetical protein